MQFYRCKCGDSYSMGSMGPARCDRCRKCGSDLALGPDSHGDPEPHRFEPEHGACACLGDPSIPQAVKDAHHPRRCLYCHRTEAEIAAADLRATATHRCVACNARWRRNADGTWTRCQLKAGSCCDNAPADHLLLPLEPRRG